MSVYLTVLLHICERFGARIVGYSRSADDCLNEVEQVEVKRKKLKHVLCVNV